MVRNLILLLILVILASCLYFQSKYLLEDLKNTFPIKTKNSHWLVLHRKSNKEYLYFGESGNIKNSSLVKVFLVKAGVPNQKPTPLPSLLGKKYWTINKKYESFDNPETAPYFLSLNVPVSLDPPFGPSNYPECPDGCNWELPGEFGLHGINGNETKLSESDPGSSGCVRHSDEDISFLYGLLEPEKEEIRYYVKDV